MLLLLLALAHAQSPDERWQTVQTEHFRVSYPLCYEGWALDAARRLDAIREETSAEIGFDPPRITTAAVMDPWSSANGFALPFVSSPVMGLFPTAPEAGSTIGHYRLWAEDLAVHEDAHLVHLLRPPRNGIGKLTTAWTGMGPIARKSPSWVIEGYATVVEGRLSGLGRPHSAGRAAFLRQLAQDGELPTYGELNSSARWRGGSMRYLVGSAYLEWLEARAGDGSLRDLWARMSAKAGRSFEDAFTGVFGDSPAVLYHRFTAELAHDAIGLEAVRPPQQGTLFADFKGSTGAPTLSPDGSRVALVVKKAGKRSRLVVYETAEDPKAREQWEEARSELTEHDPADVPARTPRAWAHKLETTRQRAGRIPQDPRWMADGETLLWTAWAVDAKGDLTPDLYSWNTSTHRQRRLTHHARISQADPHGDFAVGVRSEGGSAALVLIDPESGAWTNLTEPDPTAVFDQPRVSPDGTRVAVLAQRSGWTIEIQPLDGSLPTTVPLPDEASVSALAWTPDGASLHAVLGRSGALEDWTIELATGVWTERTRSAGGLWAIDPTPDGEALFALVPDARGFELHRFPLDASLEATPSVELLAPMGVTATAWPSFSPVQRPPDPAARPLPALDPSLVAHPYGLGHVGFRPLVGATAGPGTATAELAAYLGDQIGRWELLVLGALPRGAAVGGGSVAATWRGLPVHLQLMAFTQASEQLPARGGVELAAFRERPWQGGGLEARAGGTLDQPFDSGPGTQAAFGTLRLHHRAHPAALWLGVDLEGAVRIGSEGGLARGGADLSVGLGDLSLGAGGEIGLADSTLTYGGMPSSVQPPGQTTSRWWDPAWAPDTLAAAQVQEAHATLGLGAGLSLFASRARGGSLLEGADGATAIGLRLQTDTDPQPLARVPGAHLDLGLACHPEEPGTGWSSKPCTALGDYTGWMGFTYTPGRPTRYP